MNINIYLEDRLGRQLNQLAEGIGKSRNTIIREAVREWVEHHQAKHWPNSILNFKGCPNLPAFESLREELTSPPEDPLA